MVNIINGVEYVLRQNDVIFLPLGTLRERPEGETVVKYVSFNFMPFADIELSFPQYMPNVISGDLIKLASVFPGMHFLEYDHSKEKIACILNYMLYERKEPVSYGTNDDYVIKALRFVDDHIHEAISLSSVSRYLIISREYMATAKYKANFRTKN